MFENRGLCLFFALCLPHTLCLRHTLCQSHALCLFIALFSFRLARSLCCDFIFYFKNGITLQMPQMCNILKIEKHLFASTSITNECNICAYGTHNLHRITDYSFQTEYKPSRSNLIIAFSDLTSLELSV